MYLSNKFSTIKTIKDDLKGDNLVKIMDKALKHLNKISVHNLVIISGSEYHYSRFVHRVSEGKKDNEI